MGRCCGCAAEGWPLLSFFGGPVLNRRQKPNPFLPLPFPTTHQCVPLSIPQSTHHQACGSFTVRPVAEFPRFRNRCKPSSSLPSSSVILTLSPIHVVREPADNYDHDTRDSSPVNHHHNSSTYTSTSQQCLRYSPDLLPRRAAEALGAAAAADFRHEEEDALPTDRAPTPTATPSTTQIPRSHP